MKRVMRVVGEVLVAALLLIAANEAWIKGRAPAEAPEEFSVPSVLIIEVNKPKSWRM